MLRVESKVNSKRGETAEAEKHHFVTSQKEYLRQELTMDFLTDGSLGYFFFTITKNTSVNIPIHICLKHIKVFPLDRFL